MFSSSIPATCTDLVDQVARHLIKVGENEWMLLILPWLVRLWPDHLSRQDGKIYYFAFMTSSDKRFLRPTSLEFYPSSTFSAEVPATANILFRTWSIRNTTLHLPVHNFVHITLSLWISWMNRALSSSHSIPSTVSSELESNRHLVASHMTTDWFEEQQDSLAGSLCGFLTAGPLWYLGKRKGQLPWAGQSLHSLVFHWHDDSQVVLAWPMWWWHPTSSLQRYFSRPHLHWF